MSKLIMSKIKKYKLIQLVSKKIEYSIHQLHILSVVNIFIEEMMKDLKNDKKIKIINFGTFELNKIKPKKIQNIITKKPQITKQTNALRFKLFRKISNIFSNIHFDK